MDEKLIKTIAWSGRAAISSKHATASSAEPNSVVVDGATFTHGYVSVNGIRLHYLMGGDGERPVLLVHGFPGSWRSWEPLMGALVHAGFTPLVPDYRGAGETDISVGGYDKKSMAHDLHELATLLNIKQVDIIGHDMGLIIAYAYGALYPDETGHIVLMVGLFRAFLDGNLPITGIPQPALPANGIFASLAKRPLA